MKLLVFSALLFLFAAGCNSSDKESEAKTDIDVARTFVNAIMKNDFDKASAYMLKDSVNESYLYRFQEYNKRLSKEKLDEQKNGFPVVNETSYVSDSVFIFNYSPSFNRAEKNKIKLVRINNKWLVDFKYTFSGNL